jgi:hypothetical protein
MSSGHDSHGILVLKAVGVVLIAVVIATYILSRFDP